MQNRSPYGLYILKSLFFLIDNKKTLSKSIWIFREAWEFFPRGKLNKKRDGSDITHKQLLAIRIIKQFFSLIFFFFFNGLIYDNRKPIESKIIFINVHWNEKQRRFSYCQTISTRTPFVVCREMYAIFLYNMFYYFFAIQTHRTIIIIMRTDIDRRAINDLAHSTIYHTRRIRNGHAREPVLIIKSITRLSRLWPRFIFRQFPGLMVGRRGTSIII